MTTTNDTVATDESVPNENIVLRVSDLRIDTVAGDEILHGVSFAVARGRSSASSESRARARPRPDSPAWAISARASSTAPGR